jgi:hypothetical protein
MAVVINADSFDFLVRAAHVQFKGCTFIQSNDNAFGILTKRNGRLVCIEHYIIYK